MKDLLLGIDIGTTSAKAALFSDDGVLLSAQQAEYPLHHVQAGWVEQEPDDWWRAASQAIRMALSDVPHAADRMAGIAVSAQAPTLLPLDASLHPLRRALIWMDRRAGNEADFLASTFGYDSIVRDTGNRPDAFYVAPRLLWFRRHEPDLFARTRLFMQINGYIALRLTGKPGMDPVHAALLGLRHHASGQWLADICDACGVSPDLFPAVLDGHSLQGVVTKQAAAATGLRPGTPVMAGTVDGAAAALEAGAAAAGQAAEMTGTSTVLMFPNTTGVVEPAFIAMPHAIPGLRLLLGAMVASGGSLRWFRDQLGAGEVMQAAQTGADAFDLLTASAAQVPAGSDGLIFLPYMMGERAPIWHTQARGVFIGLTLATTRAAMVRAVLEGTAFAMLHNIEVARAAGVPVNEIRSVGGGARSPLWNQIKADVTGLPVLLPQAGVGAPFGDAMLAGLGAGMFTDLHRAVAERVRIAAIFEPNPETHVRYQAIYPHFRSIYAHLRQDFDDMAATFARFSLPGER